MKLFLNIILILALIPGCKSSGTNRKQAASQPLEKVAEFSTRVPEPSGLVYFKKNNTLLTVSDQNSKVYEISLEGETLNSFQLSSIDMEGIALTRNEDTLIIASEHSQSIDTYLFNGDKLSSFTIPVATEAKHSLEGVSIDKGNSLYVINEKKPCMLLKYSNGEEIFCKKITLAEDLSDIFYDEESKCLWVLSDESAKVMKLSLDGELISEYSIPFENGEGITIYNGNIYIINDANGKLYVFRKP